MSLDFFKWPLRSSFRGSAEQEAPPEIVTNSVWLDALHQNPPTPDEPVEEFAAYFQCLEEAVRAKQYVDIGPSGRVRPTSPQYMLEDEEAAQKTEEIFRAVFENEAWAEQDHRAMRDVWKTVPNSLMKVAFKHEESLATPATIFRTAESKQLLRAPTKPIADNLINLADYRHDGSPTPPDDGGADALVVEASL